MTGSSGFTCGKCLKNFFCLELLNAFRFFSFFSLSLALVVVDAEAAVPTSPDEDFCVFLSLSRPSLLLTGDDEALAFFEESLKGKRNERLNLSSMFDGKLGIQP